LGLFSYTGRTFSSLFRLADFGLCNQLTRRASRSVRTAMNWKNSHKPLLQVGLWLFI
jgi:hypothetical protein